MAAVPQTYLGIDCSTQAIKLVVIDEALRVTHEAAVNYDQELPQYATKGGVHRATDGNPATITSPPQLWIAALEMALQKLRSQHVDFSSIVAVSGSGQQHGSVFWRKGAHALLAKLTEAKSLVDQLSDCFSVANSPIWMDSSTTPQCLALEKALGGPQQVAAVTGSRAYERFTRNQIQKVFEKQHASYENTERISLVSSFIASLLIGDYAPIDLSDGSGMNLLDLKAKSWNDEILRCSAPGLADRLGAPSESHKVVGKVASYYVKKYHFSPDCKVIACAGDNPNSVVGMRLARVGDISISLGTSDTLFGTLDAPRPSANEGHIFCNPAHPASYMALVCYKNGSLTREDVRDRVASGSWEHFDKLFSQTAVGNNGKIGFFFKETEITPQGAIGIHRFADGAPVPHFTPAEEVRAVVEGQFLSMRFHSNNIGISHFKSILATGGASKNKCITQVIADVFGVPVFTAQTANSAALGAAYRALHGARCAAAHHFVPLEEVLALASPFVKIAEPNMQAHEKYTAMLPLYASLEKEIMSS